MAQLVTAPTEPSRPRCDPRRLADQIERYGCSLNVLHTDIGQDFREAALLIRELLIEAEQLRAHGDDDFRGRVQTLLAEHDAHLAQCPVNNPKNGRAFRPTDTCPRCRSTASGSCGAALTAGYRLAADLRLALGAAA